jgi:anti-anti-sigma regulatory factor
MPHLFRARHRLALSMHFPGRRISGTMLRITHTQTETQQQWTLCGQLTSPWVAELRACWEHTRQVAGRGHTVVDLTDVTFIDESGEQLLSEMSGHGAEFIATGVETKHLLKNLKSKGQRPLRRCIASLAYFCEKSKATKNGRDE